MKYLSHYMEDAQTKAFNDAGAFFAFSQEQMSKKRIKCQVYVSLGAGLYAPKSNADSLVTVLDNIYKDSMTALRNLAEFTGRKKDSRNTPIINSNIFHSSFHFITYSGLFYNFFCRFKVGLDNIQYTTENVEHTSAA